MQSSPPERAWKRPSSPAGSQYSVDLAALDLQSRSGASSPLQEQHVDRVRSEDIDGPSDFTMNMETWVRGGTMRRGTMKGMKKGLESLRETRDEGVQANGSFLTPRKHQDEEQSASHHTPSNSPPLDSVYGVRSKFDHAGGDLSEWDPYTDGEESTPEPPAHTHFLQPTVEDYYSEFSPARMPSIRRTKSASSRTHVAGEEAIYEKGEPSSPGRPSSETLSPVRSPARSPVRSPTLHPSAPRQFSSQSTEATFEKQMEDLQAKCKQLELLNAALGQAVDEERRMRMEDKAAHERRVADAERRERELNEMKDHASVQRDDYRNDLGEAKTKVAQLEKERGESGRGLEIMRQQYSEEVRRISQDAQREKAEQNASIRALEQDLDFARRGRDAAEETERAMRAELDRRHAELDDLDRMQSDLTQIEDPDDRVHELEDELREARSQMEKLSAAKKEAEDEASGVRAELASLSHAQDDETTRFTTDHRRAVAVAEDLQVQLKKLREQSDIDKIAHKAELDRMREDATRSPTKDDEAQDTDLEAKQTSLNNLVLERDALRDDLEAQQSKLNAAILERDDAQDAATDTITNLQTSLQEARDALSDQAAISVAIDAKVSAAIAKREAYWRGRVEASEKERMVMVKALLRQWGREEVGPLTGEVEGGLGLEGRQGRQGYEYRFVGKRERGSGGGMAMAVDAIAGA